MNRLLVPVLLIGVFCAVAADCGEERTVAGPLISRAEFFAGLDYSLSGMAVVKKASDAGDYESASRALLDYMRSRTNVKYSVNPHGMPSAKNPNYDTTAADDNCGHIPNANGTGAVVNWFPPYHFPGDKMDWAANPYDDPEWYWGLNRHYTWGTLADAYWATHDEKYAREYVDELTDWVRTRPVVTDGKHNSSSSWRTIEAGIRMGQTWPHAYLKFLDSPSFTPEANLLALMSMVDHARHLEKNPTSGNWLVMERNGLLHVAVLLPEFKESAKWRKDALDTLTDQLHAQVYPDGMQFELSTGYHRVCIGNFTAPLDLCALNGIDVPTKYRDLLEKLYEAEIYLMKPCGYMTGFNDADSHIESIAGTGSWVDAKGDLRSGTARFARPDMLYAATGGRDGDAPADISHAFPYAGYYMMRQGWSRDSLYFGFDAGPFGAGHQHEDKLGFEACAYGETLLFDSGRDGYHAGAFRQYAVSTVAHNTSIVDGKGQARARQKAMDRKWIVKGPLSNPWVSESGFDYAEGVYDDGYGAELDKSVTHRRAVLFVKNDYWLVLDHFEGQGKHIIDTFFHFAPGKVEADKGSLECVSANPNRPNVRVFPSATKGVSVGLIEGRESPCQGWISTEYNKRVAAPVADYTYTGTLPAEFAYLIYPSPKSQRFQASIEQLSTSAGGRASAYAVTRDSGAKDFILLAHGVLGIKQFAGFETDAQVAVVRKSASGRTTKVSTYGGTFLRAAK